MNDGIDKMRRYAYVRDRATEHEPRLITITDDEAMEILDALEHALEAYIEAANPGINMDEVRRYREGR